MPHREVIGDTIFAAATGAGRAAIAIIRISGPRAAALLSELTGGRPPPPRHAALRRLRDAAGELLDTAVVLWLPGPASYTGEDCAELHLHGGTAVLDGVSVTLAVLGARPAEPGEFTLRAFLNGRMDLTEAEAVADLIDAETAAQRVQALRQLDGGLRRMFDDLARDLTDLLALHEALIDFPDEAEISESATRKIEDLAERIEMQLDDDRRGERLRSGLVFVVLGPPNVGKSSLVNALAERDAAIVSPAPGTTRDVLEIRALFGGVPVTLLDTAGLRDSDDPVEREGVRRARARATTADLVIVVNEAGRESKEDFPPASLPPASLRVANKADQAPAAAGWIAACGLAPAGVALLRDRLGAIAQEMTAASGAPPLTRARHRSACLEASRHLRMAIDHVEAELRAEELRLALRALGRVTGRVGVEDVLGVVFSRFCIGK